ncbi:hypothetical protein EV138_2736 [Kribbella voronezhensis]|uniref:Uncharacterized protein n=1 Tax=Kribbella voronezhensis TaxID=2512212 RepID=A0A4R7TCI3_9ACTN|nr:hypothetical protein EV138_2736 [Kribbella voronezhensis]
MRCGEPVGQDTACGRGDLDSGEGGDAGALEPEIDAADAGAQRHQMQAGHLLLLLVVLVPAPRVARMWLMTWRPIRTRSPEPSHLPQWR